MGLLDFVKDAGEKLFGAGKAKASMQEAAAAPADPAKVKAANDAAGDAIMAYIDFAGPQGNRSGRDLRRRHVDGLGVRRRAGSGHDGEDRALLRQRLRRQPRSTT